MAGKTVAIFLFLLSTATAAVGAGWQAISNSSTQAQFSTDSITCDSQTCNVWVQYKYPPDVLLENFSANPLYEKYVHTVAQWQLDCKNKRSGILSGVDYTVDGGVIESGSTPNPTLTEVTPDSEGSARLEAICGYLTAHPELKKWQGPEWLAIPNSSTHARFDINSIRCESHFCGVTLEYMHPQDALARYASGNPKYENYSHSVAEWSLDCKNKRSGIVKIVDYSVDDRIIDTGFYRNWTRVNNIPDSEEAIRWDAICGYISSLDVYKKWYQ